MCWHCQIDLRLNDELEMQVLNRLALFAALFRHESFACGHWGDTFPVRAHGQHANFAMACKVSK